MEGSELESFHYTIENNLFNLHFKDPAKEAAFILHNDMANRPSNRIGPARCFS
jgi:hypothetical protein